MLATASERFPRGGALLMGLMGTAGTLSIRFVLPIMGAIYDSEEDRSRGRRGRVQCAPAGPRTRACARHRRADSFRAVAILPAILLLVFGGIWLYDRRLGGLSRGAGVGWAGISGEQSSVPRPAGKEGAYRDGGL